MKQSDRMEILRRAVTTHSQAAVARRIGRSGSTISQVLSGKYPGATDAVLEMVAVAYGDTTIDCPVLGNDTPLSDCVDARARTERPLVVSSGQTVRLYRACQTCRHNGKGGSK